MKNSKDSLGDRMKKIESINRHYLIPKLHTVIRCDGCHFHTYTKKFKRPFDEVLINAMDQTAIYLCSKIQGAKFALVQSDEITIYLSDRDSLETSMWYDGNVQKMVSVSAAMATSAFNKFMMLDAIGSLDTTTNSIQILDIISKLQQAEFDSRVFQLPNEHEVVNSLLWRQLDTIRNSRSSVAQSLFSAKELHKKNQLDMVKMSKEKGVDWDLLDPKLQRGRFIDRITYVNDIASTLISDGINTYHEPINKVSEIFYLNKNDFILKKTDKVRTKWESVEIPEIINDREFLLSRIK